MKKDGSIHFIKNTLGDIIMKKIMISDYCMVKQKYSKANTIIVFSSVRTPKGKFRFTHALNDFDGNVIYLNSKKGNDWYTEGIEGLGEDYTSTTVALKKLIDQYSGTTNKILTLGGSMGGYGAVLYGSLIDADYSLSSGTELITTLYLGRSIHCDNKINTSDMKNIIANSKCHHHMIAGSNDPVDMLTYSYYQDNPGISWYIFKNKPHGVIKYIHNKYNILSSVEQILLKGKPEFYSSDLEIPKYDLSEYIDNYLISALTKTVIDFKIALPRNKILIQRLEKKRNYSQLIINLLGNKDLQKFPGMLFIYFKALIKEENTSEAKRIYSNLLKTKLKEKAEKLVKDNNLFE